MAIKEIKPDQLKEIIAKTGFDYDLVVKDYYVTCLLYLIRDIKGIYFKGGTALQKTVLNYSRISEDIDFTLDSPIDDVKREVINKIKDSGEFKSINKDKDVDQFTRLIVHYKTVLGQGNVLLDLNERASLAKKPQLRKIKHFYPNIPEFSFWCLAEEEMIAEKVVAAIARNKPRDHFDIYRIITQGLSINMDLVRLKCEQSDLDPSIITMFNKAKKLHNRWQQDMAPLLQEKVSFIEVMKTLAGYFNLKKEKDLLKKG